MRRSTMAALILALACAPSHHETPPAPKPNIDPGAREPSAARVPPQAVAPAPAKPAEDSIRRVAPPQAAYAHGWMPLASTGVDRFRREHPDLDGRGVLIGILDTGLDPSVPGFGTTTTGSPKIVDVRDFSGEGAIALTRITPSADSVSVGGRRLAGFGRVTSLNPAGPYFGGTIAELSLGGPPAADLNRNGNVLDTLPLVVTRAADGWVLLADTDGDGSLANEKPVHDYLTGRETFGWAPRGLAPRVAIAANFTDSADQPSLDLVFDTFGHGTHVSGIAAGHDIYAVPGFDGVAPGAQLLGLKIANGANGGITTTGSMRRGMDYAIRFAHERKIPLVLNMSFGVGNEIEGSARIDAVIDSTLQRNPDVVMVIAGGNDGPGLSSLGFPGSADAAIGIGATLPSAFLAPGSNGAPQSDQLAYFSSRGGEVAKPDIATPGMAYSTVPLWNAGDEVEQGTSMAAPHAAGLAALLVSGLIKERKPVESRAVKQALMVTATPTAGMTFLDEGTGVPDVGRAWKWLEAGHAVDAVRVRAVGPGDVTGALRRITTAVRDTVQTFELIRAAGTPAATYTLRSDAPWLTAPASVTLKGERTRVDVRYAGAGLREPGAHVGVVTGWGKDTLAGPAFRLVNAIAVGAPVVSGSRDLRSKERMPPGGVLRTFFRADSIRPFALTVSTGGMAEHALAFLHEPDGMPFRDEAARQAGFDQQSAEYEADARDVVSGVYESIVVALPGQSPSASVTVTQSPLSLRASRRGAEVRATLVNLTKTDVSAEVGMHLGGAAREETVTSTGSDPVRIPFVLPAWSRGVVVDVTMDRAQWGRFTDFGLTLLDSTGKQLGKQPLNYAFGRLEVESQPGHGEMPVTLMFLPGFTDSSDKQKWTLHASIRIYADSSKVLASTSTKSDAVNIPAGKTVAAAFTMPADPWPLEEKFVPLALLVARVDGRTWTREAALVSAPTQAAR